MRVRRLLIPVVVVLAVMVAASGTTAAAPDPPADRIELTIFYGEGCPYCARELAFLADLQTRQPLLDVVAHEVWYSEQNRELLRTTAAAYGVDPDGVPITFLGDAVWVGFDSTVQSQIEAAVAELAAGRTPVVEERSAVDIPFVGDVDVGGSSMVVATILIGFADGINPCSLWVLSMLLALVLHSGSRKRIALVGLTFLTVTSALYGLYMVGAYSALDYVGELTWIRVFVAVVAGTFGVLHLKEYVTDRGPSLTIPDKRKPDMYRRMRSVARPERSLPAVLAGTAALAVGVSLAETPCTAGLPLLWTNMLSARDASAPAAVALFALYLLVFLIDELVLFGITVVTLRSAKLQEHHGRVLQLTSGLLMVALAVAMLFAPQLLESVSGTMAVFGGTALLAGGIVAIDHLATGRHAPPHRLAGR